MLKRRKNFFLIGMTIIEAMVAVSIFTISIGGLTLLFLRTWQNNHYVLEMGQSSMAVSEGMRKMVGYIRMARQGDDGSYPVKSASGNDLVVYSDYDKDGVTERLHFYKSGQNILMGVTDPTVAMPKTYPSGDQQIITIVSNIVNGASDNLFSYYNQNYPIDTQNNPLSFPVTVSSIRLIKIYLHINVDPNRAPDNIQVQSFVELRNLNDYDRLK